VHPRGCKRAVLSGLLALAVAAAPGGLASATAAAQGPSTQPLDVIYVPTPTEVVRQMLATSKVGPGDVVFDLGSGDGRIPIAAVRDFGAARGVGIELDPQRIAEARANAVAAGVSDRVEFLQQDLFVADLSGATVIAMYLLPAINARLQPKLRGLKPGTRIVSHNYDMGNAWKPVRSFVVDNSLIHFWTVPKR
jgi:SAM-dependent methyltransferase